MQNSYLCLSPYFLHFFFKTSHRALCRLEDERVFQIEKVECLQSALQQSEETNRHTQMKFQKAEAAAKALRHEAVGFKKAKDLQTKESDQSKEQLKALRQEVRELQAAHKSYIEKTKSISIECDNKNLEIMNLKDTLERQKRKARKEKESLEAKIRKIRQNHRVEIEAFREEFVEMQDSHRAYLLNLMDMLESANSKRAADAALISKELDTIREIKDHNIQQLETELELARKSSHSKTLPPIEEGLNSDELRFMRFKVEESTSLRLERSKEFKKILKKIQLAVKPENMKYIIDKVKKHHGSPVEKRVFAEIHKMAGILGDLYMEEEQNQENADQKMLALLERGIISVDPDQAVQELQQKLCVVEERNKKLEKHIKAQDLQKCERCAIRDSRRLAVKNECAYDDWSSLADWTLH